MSDDNVIIMPVVTTIDVPVDRALDAAKESDLEDAVIVGFTKDGEFYFSSSCADGADVNWLLDLAKKGLMEIASPDD